VTSTAYQEREHRPLPIERIADGVRVAVLRLEVHLMVVFERRTERPP
jgi:hypothetical protein